jgi:hypothetical protein
MAPHDETPKASWIEILGAWLHLWTPPRDCYVPPVPWRKVALGAAVLVAAGVVTALVIAPAIDEGKDRSAAEERRALEQRRAARRARIREEQRARFGRLERGAPREASLRAVEAAIGRDAAQRFDTDGSPAGCEPAPAQEVSGPRVLYDCHVTVREIVAAGEQEGARGRITIPYRALLQFRAARYAFCKVNPRPGELSIGQPEDIVALPKPCRLY